MFTKSNLTTKISSDESLEIKTDQLHSLIESDINQNHVKPFNEIAKRINLNKLDVSCTSLLFQYKRKITSTLELYNNLSLMCEAGLDPNGGLAVPSKNDLDQAEIEKNELVNLKQKFNDSFMRV